MNGRRERTEDDMKPEAEIENLYTTATVAGEEDLTADQSTSGTADADADPIATLQLQVEENWNKYLRAVAELENVRKRAARDVDNARRFAIERFSADLLAVCDSLEMGLSMSEGADIKQVIAGSENTLKLLVATLERFGIQPIDPVGEPFDPDQHEAVAMQPSSDVEPGSVLTVFQKGYSLNGRLLRPARVLVAQDPADAAASE